jgi:putative Mn2+ efflux pump MntP
MAIIAEIITLGIMAVALGMDAFSVSLGMGMMRLRLKHIFYIGVTVGLFHVFMPFFGMIAGQFLSFKFGMVAQYIGGVLLIVLGLQMIIFSFKKDAAPVMNLVGWGMLLFALSVSLDSFSVGLSLGIFGARTAAVLICFGAAAMLLTWLGLLIGRKFQGWLGIYGEVFGGTILILFGVKLLLSV